ncbi:MAG TPA: hypothetical protein VF449_01730, partial [Parvibaculum sp.]
MVRLCCRSMLAAAALMLAVHFAPTPAAAEETPLPAQAKIWSPEVLSGADRERYLKIFAAEKRADWKRADKIIAELSDRRLMAYVLAERYLNPRYKAKYAELRAWMAQYSGVPGADKVYKLALKKRPHGAAAPEHPAVQHFRQPSSHTAYAVDDGDEPAASPRFAKIDAHVRELVRDAKAIDALNYLSAVSTRQTLTDVEFDRIRERIACSFFIENDNQHAYDIASDIARSHGRQVPLADWYAGLAAWRMERYDDAAEHFERLARSETASDWSKAAGGFWAA